MRSVGWFYCFHTIYEEATGAAAIKVYSVSATKFLHYAGNLLSRVSGDALRHVSSLAGKQDQQAVCRKAYCTTGRLPEAVHIIISGDALKTPSVLKFPILNENGPRANCSYSFKVFGLYRECRTWYSKGRCVSIILRRNRVEEMVPVCCHITPAHFHGAVTVDKKRSTGWIVSIGVILVKGIVNVWRKKRSVFNGKACRVVYAFIRVEITAVKDKDWAVIGVKYLSWRLEGVGAAVKFRVIYSPNMKRGLGEICRGYPGNGVLTLQDIRRFVEFYIVW